LALVSPPTAAQAGRTFLRVYGDGFGPDTQVLIGDVAGDIIERVSSAELHVWSPHLGVGTYDAVVRDGERSATLARALTLNDPRSGYGGTWGPPIDETVNVTVYGSGGYGPVAGAFVILGHDPATPWQGVTDENGQVTISGPGLYGPVDATASREGFTSYSVVAFDATNLTIILQQNPTPPPQQGSGGDDPYIPPPDATISGQVRGLDKYVLAPPGSCAALAIPDTAHCRACGPDAPVPQCDAGLEPGADPDTFACVNVGDEGLHCLARCEVDSQCPQSYTCGSTPAGGRCVPSLGAPAAYCNISSPSLFGYEYPIQPTGWVDATGHYTLDSMRLGEVAIYCFGGYRDAQGVFTPTVMGVERHLFAGPGQVFEHVDIDFTDKLERSFRLRLQDPPTWTTGLADPQVVISLDLGADGVIPFSRQLIPVGDDRLTWIAPHELSQLSGDLYDGNFFFYTTLSPNDYTSYQPRAYNLVQNVRHIVEDRMPVRSPSGAWRLEGTQLAKDLYAVWARPDGQAAFAVGEAGLILGWTAAGWTAQTSFTEQSLRAVAGSDQDVWAVGDGGTVRHWDGLAWHTIDAPDDLLGAVAVFDDHVIAAGSIRLRRYDRTTGTWEVVGGPSLQEVRGLVALPDGRVLALGTHRRAWLGSADGRSWSPLAIAPVAGAGAGTPVGAADATLRAGLVRADGSWVVVGDMGTVLSGGESGLAPEESPTPLDLNALVETPDGELVIVGDHGTTLSWVPGARIRVEEITDYRSEAHGVFVDGDGSARIVGSAAFILGPFLHFPVVTTPIHDATLDALAFAWTWDGGPPNQYTQLRLTPEASITLWTMIVGGDETSVLLPDLEAAAGISALPSGRIRFEVLRVLNANFSIDDYTTRDFSIYKRDSWSTNEAYFYLP
ncbi:MAG: hypothetical protein U1F43_37790, partial [Myxococcota bacterium]